jgi:hypothetical protein
LYYLKPNSYNSFLKKRLKLAIDFLIVRVSQSDLEMLILENSMKIIFKMERFYFRPAIILVLLIFVYPIVMVKAQEHANIPFSNSNILIDGIADEVWNGIQPHAISYLIDGTGYPSESDCSGYFKAFWKPDTLFVLIHAIDNALFTGDATVYLNDGFEIYLDLDDSKEAEYTNDCYQFRFIPGSSEISGRWGLNVWTPPTVNFAIDVDANFDRTIEAVFPVKQLGRKNAISAGDSMGFEVEILDNDGSGRNHVLSWNKNEHMAWYDPSQMGTIKFVESTTGVNDLDLNCVSIFPNPTTNRVVVKASSFIDEISICSIQGQLLFKKKISSCTEVSLDLNSLQPSLYLVGIRFANGQYSNCKIVKR